MMLSSTRWRSLLLGGWSGRSVVLVTIVSNIDLAWLSFFSATGKHTFVDNPYPKLIDHQDLLDRFIHFALLLICTLLVT